MCSDRVLDLSEIESSISHAVDYHHTVLTPAGLRMLLVLGPILQSY